MSAVILYIESNWADFTNLGFELYIKLRQVESNFGSLHKWKFCHKKLRSHSIDLKSELSYVYLKFETFRNGKYLTKYTDK
jgi:hypothetical protein